MGRALGAVGAFCVKFRWMVLALWLIATVGLTLVTGALGPTTDNTVTLPGTGSQAATDLLTAEFPPQQNGTSPAIYHVDKGKVDDGGKNQEAITAAFKALKADKEVSSVTNPFKNPQAGFISDDNKYAFIPILLKIDSQELTEPKAERLYRTATQPTDAAGIESAVGGPIGGALDPPETGTSERLGMAAAAIILALSFGSLIAMGMPLISAVLGLVLGLAGIWLLGTFVDTPSIGVTISRMIGLGVGIDYALFLVNRHRGYVLTDGLHPHVAAARAVATSGGAITFAGGTVIIALVSLQVAGIPFIAALGFAAAVAVVGAVLAALTLLPALLAIIGSGIGRLRVPGLGRRQDHPIAARWAAIATRHPVVSVLVAVGVMIPLAVPVATLTLGQQDSAVSAPGTSDRRAFYLMTDGFGPGYNGPLLVAVSMDPPATPSNKYEKQYSQAESLQASLELAQQELPQQQAELEQQQEQLTAQGDALQAQAADLEAEEAELTAQAQQLQDQEQQLLAQAASLEQAGEELAAEARGLVGRQEQLALQLGRTIITVDLLQRRLADAANPAAEQELARLLNEAQQREQKLQQQIRSLAKGLSPAGKKALRQEKRLAKRLVANLAEQRALTRALATAQGAVVRQSLQRRLAAAQDREEALRKKLAANLADLDPADRKILREIRPLAVDLAENLALQKVLQRRLDDVRNPAVAAELQRLLAEQESKEQGLRREFAANTAALRSLEAQAEQLETEAAAIEREGRQLAAEGEDLAAQGRQLEAEAADLQAQEASLEAQAADLQQWADDLQAEADEAQQEQAQAEQLQKELTKELTKAGGDPRGTDPRIVKLQNALATPSDVDAVTPPQINEAGNALTMSVIANTRPADPLTADLVAAERDEAIPPALSPGMTADVGGSTASNVDLATLIGEKLMLVILTVIALSSLLLLIAFRSLLIPVQAAIANLLAAAASFGVVTAIFQWGWGLSAIGLSTPYGSVPVASYVPLMMFAALFGLSMDYQVFMMSTIQGEYAAGKSARDAVREGVKGASKIIVTAALIMMSVFGSFIVNDNEIVKQFGVGLTAAVGFAAFMVLLFAPAMLMLFNTWTWRLPKFLDRILPDLDLEGRGLEKRLAEEAAEQEKAAAGREDAPV